MSEHILDQHAVSNDKHSNGESVSIVTLSKNTGSFLKRKLKAFFNFLVEVSEEINKARAESARYSRMRW